jgi:hypothetical protein
VLIQSTLRNNPEDGRWKEFKLLHNHFTVQQPNNLLDVIVTRTAIDFQVWIAKLTSLRMVHVHRIVSGQ